MSWMPVIVSPYPADRKVLPRFQNSQTHYASNPATEGQLVRARASSQASWTERYLDSWTAAAECWDGQEPDRQLQRKPAKVDNLPSTNRPIHIR